MAGVAQLVRASGCGPEGRGFKSHHSPQICEKTVDKAAVFSFVKNYLVLVVKRAQDAVEFVNLS